MKNYIEPTINITKFFKSDSILLQASGDYSALQLNQTLDQAYENGHSDMAGTSTIQATREIIKLR